MERHTIKTPETDILFFCYRQAPYLKSALDSILAQTYQNYRLIAVDDGSDDGSLEILRQYESRCPQKISVWTHPGHKNRGQAESFLLGMSKTSSEYLAFLEGDDIWEPENLEKKVRALLSRQAIGVVYSSYEPFDEKKAAFYWKIHRDIQNTAIPRNAGFDNYKTLLHRNNISTFSNFVTRRSLVKDIPLVFGITGRLDWWVLSHLSARSLFYFIPEPLCRWRIHRGSVSYRKWNSKKLWRLYGFHLRLYESLRAYLPSRQETVTKKKKEKILSRALQDIELVRRTKSWFHPLRWVTRPLLTARLLGHVLLKNMIAG